MADYFEVDIRNGTKTLIKYIGKESKVIIPDGIEVIGGSAFNHCGNLTSVVIGEGTKVIGPTAFYECTSLTNVVIPSSITEIHRAAFACCTNLTSLIIPKGVKKISENAFRACHRLEIGIYYHHVYSIEPNKGEFGSILPVDFGNKTINLLDDESRRIGKLFILNSAAFTSKLMLGLVNHLSEYEASDFDAVFVDPYLPVIGKVKAALYRIEYPLELEEKYKNLYISYLKQNASFVIPTLIKSGDVEALNVLASIDAITENNSDYIEIANKYSQTEILAILLDYKDKTLGNESPSSLEFDVNKLSDDWSTVVNSDGSLTITRYRGKELSVTIPFGIMGKKVSCISASIGSLKISVFFAHKDKVQSIQIEDGIEVIDERAFLECRNLKYVVIPASVISIGKEAYYGCKSLSSVVILGGVKKIDEAAFDECPNLVIHSPKESYAIEYAKENGIKFVET